MARLRRSEQTEPGLVDERRLDAWIGDRLPGGGAPLHVERMGEATGSGNALFRVRRGGHEWVLRRPPEVVNAPGASDMVREWRLLSALEGTDVPHPRPLLLCDDVDVLGAPFLLMDVVDGFTPVGSLPPPYDNPAARRALAYAMVDALAQLAHVDWVAAGLDGLGKPDGFLERQVPRWLAQLDRYRTRDIPELDVVASWLDTNRPTMSPPAIMHGDYSPYNVMASWTTTDRLAAVIDWDTGTIGDPLLDIGHLLARWTEPGEEPSLHIDIEPRDGLPVRSELASRYADRSGRDMSAIAYYEVLSLFKLAIILEGPYSRRKAAGIPESENTAPAIDRLMRSAAAFASGARV
ncbi:MAG TPA: phosphotransferase family protein [Ilumatobacteraceae bacterium]|nr:phosphotransferase family protein [Ilumatobacteraceae bacterium]